MIFSRKSTWNARTKYTLAGSIYKGRVTRVLPGMQSAFVDIGLERDAFLYVSDFMELEEHDDDLTDVVPANRGVQDMRQDAHAQSPRAEAAPGTEAAETANAEPVLQLIPRKEPLKPRPCPMLSRRAKAGDHRDCEQHRFSESRPRKFSRTPPPPRWTPRWP